MQTAIDMIQTLVLILTLVYVAIQTHHISTSLCEMRNQMKLQVTLSMRDRAQQLNDTLLQNEQLLRQFGWKQCEIFAFKLFIDFERNYLHYDAGLIDKDYWVAQSNLIKNTLSLPWVKELWDSYHEKNEYHPKFVKYVEDLLSSADDAAHSFVESVQQA